MRSIACTAVVGSLTAGDRARIATSTSWRNTKPGSCSKVRSAPRRNASATSWCFDAIDDLVAAAEPPPAYVLLFALRFLDAAADAHPRALDQLDALAPFVRDDGAIPVAGGAPGESLKLLDLAPFPDRPVRRLFRPDAVTADLDRLAAGQQDDGGWTVDYDAYSPAAALEWRGYATVQAVRVLRANGRA